MTNHNDPLDQLSTFQIEVDGPTRDAHLDTIERALREVVVRRRPKWPLAAVVAALIAGPVAAIASDSAVPGDALYPVKLIVEPALRLFDTDVVARNRVDEVRVLIDRVSDEAVIVDSILVARAELAATDAPDASRELDRLVSDWVSDSTDSEDPPREARPPTNAPRQRDETDREAPGTQPRDREVPLNTQPATNDAATSSTSSTSSTTSTTAPTDRPRDGDGAGDRPPPP